MEQVNVIAKLADLSNQHYRNTLALSAVIELLIEQGLLTAEQIRSKAAELDASAMPHPESPTV
ncbi:hypothetical protein [Paenibacillus thalictri]